MLRARVTTEQFEQFINEQTDKDFELIGGEIVEVVSNSYASLIAAWILMRIGLFVEDNNLGYVTGADGGYIVGDERYLPDVGFISNTRQLTRPSETYIPLPPDLAVEVKSPTDIERLITIKVSNYLAVGTVVWVVYPDEQEIHIHQAGHSVQIYTVNDTLTNNDILDGFTLEIAKIFAD